MEWMQYTITMPPDGCRDRISKLDPFRSRKITSYNYSAGNRCIFSMLMHKNWVRLSPGNGHHWKMQYRQDTQMLQNLYRRSNRVFEKGNHSLILPLRLHK